MKKTLIALMALAGVASGMSATDAQNELTELINDSRYQTGESFTFGVTLDDASNGNTYCITLEENGYGIFLYHLSGKAYFAFSNTSGDATWLDDTVTVNETGTATSLTIDSASSTWFSYDIGEKAGDTYTLTRAWQPTNGQLDGADVTIDYDSANTATTITVALAGVSSQITVKNYELNAKEIKIKDSPSFTNVSFAPIPEPTTATLSLLALVGLAARRRRR